MVDVQSVGDSCGRYECAFYEFCNTVVLRTIWCCGPSRRSQLWQAVFLFQFVCIPSRDLSWISSGNSRLCCGQKQVYAVWDALSLSVYQLGTREYEACNSINEYDEILMAFDACPLEWLAYIGWWGISGRGCVRCVAMRGWANHVQWDMGNRSCVCELLGCGPAIFKIQLVYAG